jgi:hypothetical protein
MRDDDDQLRQYMPLLRRIVILVAVLTAVPVVLWTITAFVHSYVGQPKVPTYRPLAATTSTQDPASATPDTSNQSAAATPPATLSDSLPVMTQATAAAADGRSTSPAATGSLALGDRAMIADPNQPPGGPTIIAAAPQTGMQATAPDGSTEAPADTAEPTADEMLAAHPITGPVPLPRKRPRVLAMAQAQESLSQFTGAAGPPKGRVPMPRPRPDGAGAAAAAPQETTSGPIDFIQGLFQAHQ